MVYTILRLVNDDVKDDGSTLTSNYVNYFVFVGIPEMPKFQM